MSGEGEQVSTNCISDQSVIPDISRVAKNLDPDLDIPMNAAPEEVEQKIPDSLSKYFTLDTDFNPVGVSRPLGHEASSPASNSGLCCRDFSTARRTNTRRASGR